MKKLFVIVAMGMLVSGSLISVSAQEPIKTQQATEQTNENKQETPVASENAAPQENIASEKKEANIKEPKSDQSVNEAPAEQTEIKE